MEVKELDKGLDLARSCADFYVLEKLAVHDTVAKLVLDELEEKLEQQFLYYLDMTVGGELRHISQRYPKDHEKLMEYRNSLVEARNNRTKAWGIWMDLRKNDTEHDLVAQAYKLHNSVRQTNVSGPKWGLVAKVLLDRLRARLTRRSFIDRVWTLEHNNDIVLDKYWTVDGLHRVLEIQATGAYHRLIGFSSSEVQDLFYRIVYAEFDPVWLGR